MLVLVHTIIGNSADFPLINRSFNLSLTADTISDGHVEDSRSCLRHVDSGACNGCELEIHALNNSVYNIEGLRTHE